MLAFVGVAVRMAVGAVVNVYSVLRLTCHCRRSLAHTNNVLPHYRDGLSRSYHDEYATMLLPVDERKSTCESFAV